MEGNEVMLLGGDESLSGMPAPSAADGRSFAVGSRTDDAVCQHPLLGVVGAAGAGTDCAGVCRAETFKRLGVKMWR